MNFSTGLRITDLNDFITPALECIKPVKIQTGQRKTSKIIIGNDGIYTGITEEGERYNLEKVEITLNDCLACSGCVTSAETILINEQSTDEFFKKIKQIKDNNDNTLVVVSISPQSIASLAVRFNLGDLCQTHRKLKLFFRSLSVDVVLDTTFGRDFSLLETAKDLTSKMTSQPINGPLITSSCPGWICYAEKHAENKLLVPLISKVKSPQQIMGYLVKHYLRKHYMKYRFTNILHVTVMPCFDKKLEASRNKFAFSNNESNEKERDVDIVLSTGEIEKIILEMGFQFDDCQDIKNDIHEVEAM